MREKKDIVNAYSNKTLGIRNYKSEKSEFIVSDFIDDEILYEFLDEIVSGESDITPAGKAFLKAYYGFKQLAEIIKNKNTHFLSSESSSEKENEIYIWLENLVPMETISTIQNMKGNFVNNSLLLPDLLPPEDM